MSGIHDAKPNDVYRDRKGNLWIVIATHPEPTVSVASLTDCGACLVTLQRGVSDTLWDGFVRLVEEK